MLIWIFLAKKKKRCLHRIHLSFYAKTTLFYCHNTCRGSVHTKAIKEFRWSSKCTCASSHQTPVKPWGRPWNHWFIILNNIYRTTFQLSQQTKKYFPLFVTLYSQFAIQCATRGLRIFVHFSGFSFSQKYYTRVKQQINFNQFTILTGKNLWTKKETKALLFF